MRLHPIGDGFHRRVAAVHGSDRVVEVVEDGTTLLEHSEEQDAIRLIEALKVKGESLRSITTELTTRGILTKEGNTKWTHTAVNRILKRAA